MLAGQLAVLLAGARVLALDYYAGGEMLELDGRVGFVLFVPRNWSEFSGSARVDSCIKVDAGRMGGYYGHTIFCPPGPVPLRYTSVNSCSGGGLGRGGYRVAPLLSGDVVEKGAAVVIEMLLLPAITVCRKMPWLRAVKPAGPRAFIHHIAWLGCPVWAASYRKQQH